MSVFALTGQSRVRRHSSEPPGTEHGGAGVCVCEREHRENIPYIPSWVIINALRSVRELVDGQVDRLL